MRYAFYFTPCDTTVLADLGRRWIGRDERTGDAVEQPAVPGLSGEAVAAATAEARRYGFHATLKPPFALADGTDERTLLADAAEFAASTPGAWIDDLTLTRLDGFLALTEAAPSPSVQALADATVRRFDRFRRPLAAEDRARRVASGLNPGQTAMLDLWGYPYVFEWFRFHMTLSARLDGLAIGAVEAAALAWFAPVIGRPQPVDHLAVFVEPQPGGAFRRLALLPLGSAR